MILALLAAAAAPAAADDGLRERRAARRAALRAQAAAKRDHPVPVGLLVVPVDFADARAPAGWQPEEALGPRLSGGGAGSLAHYLAAASHGRARLVVLLAPLVSLPGVRADYSDVGWNGTTRTRAMARAALEGARDLGVDFARADRDQDGEVDGVLLLHAAAGRENDPDGAIVPLQYYLDAPVVQAGVRAQSYAVAAWRSTLGVWAHETAHLCGLEDRYDPGLASSGEAVPRGGLGRFSLLAAGYWGSGQGHDPALIDAYSASLVGWCDLVPLSGDGAAAVGAPTAGAAYRVWTDGAPGPEFFVVEHRDGAGPYDGGVARGWVIAHVDETLPEGQASSDQWPDRHLRARLVEADGDTGVARGLEPGDASDQFPGATGQTAFTPQTDPPSDGYGGPSGVRLTRITADSLAVDDRVRPWAEVAWVHEPEPPRFALEVRERGGPLALPVATVAILAGQEHGTFAGGATEVELPLEPAGGGRWRATAAWEAAAAPPPGAVTTFAIVVRTAAEPPAVVAEVSRAWAWTATAAPLDRDGPWPGAWSIAHLAGAGATTWHRWRPAPGVAGDGSPVLAATGAAFATADAWPDVRYENGSDVVLVSEYLTREVTAVRLVHHVELEALPTGEGIDAAVVEWQDGGGAVVPGAPVDGYPAAVAGGAQHALHGRPAFTGRDATDDGGAPVWRVDVVPRPAGPGPWRLRLRLATSPAFRDRGWLVARLDTLHGSPPARAFAVDVADGRVAWAWTGEPADLFVVEASEDGGTTWMAVAVGGPTSTVRELPPVDPPRRRRLVRVTAVTALGRVVSRPAVWTQAGPAPALGAPRPNPARGAVLIPVEAPAGATLTAYDLRGRAARTWTLAPGAHDLLWDGADGDGRRCAAGVYVLRLATPAGAATRKVTLLP